MSGESSNKYFSASPMESTCATRKGAEPSSLNIMRIGLAGVLTPSTRRTALAGIVFMVHLYPANLALRKSGVGDSKMVPSSHDSMNHDHLRERLRNLFSIALLRSILKSRKSGCLGSPSSEPN